MTLSAMFTSPFRLANKTVALSIKNVNPVTSFFFCSQGLWKSSRRPECESIDLKLHRKGEGRFASGWSRAQN